MASWSSVKLKSMLVFRCSERRLGRNSNPSLPRRDLREITRPAAQTLTEHPGEQAVGGIGLVPYHVLTLGVLGVARRGAQRAQCAHDRARADHLAVVAFLNVRVVVLSAVECPDRHVDDRREAG